MDVQLLGRGQLIPNISTDQTVANSNARVFSANKRTELEEQHSLTIVEAMPIIA